MAAANCPQRAIRAVPLLPGRVLLRLLAAFGILAFIFSAASPGDDDIQQEFYKTSKSKQCAFANYKTASILRTIRIRAVCSALAPPTPQFPRRPPRRGQGLQQQDRRSFASDPIILKRLEIL